MSGAINETLRDGGGLEMFLGAIFYSERDCVPIGEVDPNVILLAGPNGAGKRTAAPDLLHGALHIDDSETPT